MESRAKLLRHPLHPMLVMFPVALFPLLVLLDVLDRVFPGAGLATAAFWVAVAGLLSTVAAALPGFVDYAAIPDASKARRVGRVHMFVGIAVLALYAAAVWARWPVGSAPGALAVAIDVLGTIAVSVQGWLGGELVYRHHVGVRAPEEGGEPTGFARRSRRARRALRRGGA